MLERFTITRPCRAWRSTLGTCILREAESYGRVKQRVISSDLEVTMVTPAGVWRTAGGNVSWMRVLPVL